MAARFEIYKCAEKGCDFLAEVVEGGECVLSCCGKDMTRLEENTVDASKEKHVPVVERSAGGITVKVGSVPHPMEEKHYIVFIEVLTGDRLLRKHLKPGETPEAFFPVTADQFIVREYCNLHGLWRA